LRNAGPVKFNADSFIKLAIEIAQGHLQASPIVLGMGNIVGNLLRPDVILDPETSREFINSVQKLMIDLAQNPLLVSIAIRVMLRLEDVPKDIISHIRSIQPAY